MQKYIAGSNVPASDDPIIRRKQALAVASMLNGQRNIGSKPVTVDEILKETK